VCARLGGLPECVCACTHCGVRVCARVAARRRLQQFGAHLMGDFADAVGIGDASVGRVASPSCNVHFVNIDDLGGLGSPSIEIECVWGGGGTTDCAGLLRAHMAATCFRLARGCGRRCAVLQKARVYLCEAHGAGHAARSPQPAR
jgi:hypothetical protein